MSSKLSTWHSPKYISWLLEAVPNEAFQLNWWSGHHMLLFLPLHRNRRNWNNLWHFSSALRRYQWSRIFAWRFPTYDVKLENLADFGVCGHLAVKVARVRRIGEFQLQRILPASGGRRGSIRTISNFSIDPITSINHNLYLLQSWSTSSNPINGISQEFHSNTQWLVTYTFQELQMRHEITIYVNDNTNVIVNANMTMSDWWKVTFELPPPLPPRSNKNLGTSYCYLLETNSNLWSLMYFSLPINNGYASWVRIHETCK